MDTWTVDEITPRRFNFLMALARIIKIFNNKINNFTQVLQKCFYHSLKISKKESKESDKIYSKMKLLILNQQRILLIGQNYSLLRNLPSSHAMFPHTCIKRRCPNDPQRDSVNGKTNNKKT